jgi:hypothetical protein
MKRLALSLALTLTSLSALAGTIPGTVPEPDALSLLGIGAVAGLVVWVRNRNKK